MDPQLLAQRKKIQMEIMLKDSDVKKIERLLMGAEISMRELKSKQTQIQSELLIKENQMKKLASEKIQLQTELIKLKHQVNSLGR